MSPGRHTIVFSFPKTLQKISNAFLNTNTTEHVTLQYTKASVSPHARRVDIADDRQVKVQRWGNLWWHPILTDFHKHRSIRILQHSCMSTRLTHTHTHTHISDSKQWTEFCTYARPKRFLCDFSYLAALDIHLACCKYTSIAKPITLLEVRNYFHL
jgi:hypothetical protein